jgi:hypothetical protein
MKETVLAFILFSGIFDLLSQEWHYYDDFNYAYEILTTNRNNREIEEADSIFKYLFNNSENHHLQEVINVVNQRSRQEGKQEPFYINTMVQVAEKYKNYKRETNMLLLTRREFNSIKKELNIKSNRRKKTLSLFKMLLTEQRARRKNRNVFLADSLNAIKVKKMLSDTNLIRDLTYLNKNLLELLIMHGGISLYRQELDLIRYYIGGKRYLSRELLSTLVERDAAFGGITYKVINNKLIPNDKNKKICPIDDGYNLFYSNIGEFRYNINKKKVYVPIDPDLSLEEINQVRRYCFLPNYSQNSNDLFMYPSATEWCEIVKDYD